jgi:uncharacterized protein YjbI with pentapeptide repeats
MLVTEPCRLLLALTALTLVAHPNTVAGQALPKITRAQVEAVLKLSRNLSLRDMRGLDLTGLNFSGANLNESDLTGARLDGAILRGAKLHRTVLVQASLRRAELAAADLTEANVSEAKLDGVAAVGSNWTGATLENAHLRGADFSKADLLGANLRRASAREIRLTEAMLVRAVLRGADLRGASFEGATLTLASLADADLTGANFRATRLIRTDFANADVADALFAGADVATAQNLDLARNVDRAHWRVREVAPTAPAAATGQIVARITPRNGDPIDVESLQEQDETFFYSRGGISYGIPKGNVRRIQDATGRTLREFVEPIPLTTARPDCARPRVGDLVSYMTNYVGCMTKAGLRVTTSRGISARAAGEAGSSVVGAASGGTVLRRWEVRDAAGRLLEAYEAIGDDPIGRVTLASE